MEVCHNIFTTSHLHIFLSSHLIFTSSHLLIFTSSHRLISSSHLLIFTSSHLHIFTSSHLHIFTSSHFLISCSYVLISHLLWPSCPLALLCSLALFSLLLFYFSLKAGAVPTRRLEMQIFRSKRGAIVKNWGKSKIGFSWVRRELLARNEVRPLKTEVKARFSRVLRQLFRTK